MLRYLFIIWNLFIGILIFNPVDAFSAPAYGTHMPKLHRWTFGFEGSFLLDRDMEDGSSTRGNRYFYIGSFGLFDWLSLDGKIGVGNVQWHRTDAADFEYNTGFSGAYGFRVRGFENRDLDIKSLFGFQHISVHPDARNIDGTKNEIIVDDWQFSFIISKGFERFVPYGGVRVSTLDLIRRTNEADRKRLKADENFGLTFGLDYYFNERLKANIEGAFVDGEEIAVGITYDF